MEGLETAMKALWEAGDMAKADPECLPMGFDAQVSSHDVLFLIGISQL